MLIWMAQGTAVVAVLMFVLWLLHFPLRNAAIVDVGWAIGLVFLAIIYAMHGVGYWRRTLFLIPMVMLWGLRLGLYLLFTRATGQPEEGRYAELRGKMGIECRAEILVVVLRGTGTLVRGFVAAVSGRDARSFERLAGLRKLGPWALGGGISGRNSRRHSA